MAPPRPLSSRELDVVQSEKFAARFRAKVGLPDVHGCLPWLASKTKDGYGQIGLEGRVVRAHRVAWVLAHGRDVAPGLVLDHLCDRGQAVGCVNPNHLAEATQRENLIRPGSRALAAAHAARTHCPRLHALADWNAVAAQARRGLRSCLACHDARAAAYAARARGVEWSEEEIHAYADVLFTLLAEDAGLHVARDELAGAWFIVDGPDAPLVALPRGTRREARSYDAWAYQSPRTPIPTA